MLRNDGSYHFYKIQHQQKDGEWVYSIYGTPEIDKESGLGDKFTASGYCWQQTGEHGVYDIKKAKIGLRVANKDMLRDVKNHGHKKLKLRIVLVSVIQTTIPIKI